MYRYCFCFFGGCLCLGWSAVILVNVGRAVHECRCRSICCSSVGLLLLWGSSIPAMAYGWAFICVCSLYCLFWSCLLLLAWLRFWCHIAWGCLLGIAFVTRKSKLFISLCRVNYKGVFSPEPFAFNFECVLCSTLACLSYVPPNVWAIGVQVGIWVVYLPYFSSFMGLIPFISKGYKAARSDF